MNWRTHIAVGANAVWLMGLQGHVDDSIIVLLPAAMLASLLPDLDAGSAKIHYIGKGALGGFKGLFRGKYFHHRGIMHSLLVTVIVFIITWAFSRNSIPLLPYVVALSYFSHSLIDGFNAKVGYLYPFSGKMFAFLPLNFRARVKGPFDTMLLFVGLSGVAIFFLLHANQFLSPTLTY